MTTAVTIIATISVILIIENQNSASPNALTAMRLMVVSAARKHNSISHFQAPSSMPKVRKKVTKYVLTAVISVMPISTRTSQYDQPANLPQPWPRYRSMKLMKVCWLGSRYIISPMARISRNMIAPTAIYTRTMLGPVSAMDLPEPRNRPVPMVPPMAMNCTWRLVSPRSIWLPLSRLSTDAMRALSRGSDSVPAGRLDALAMCVLLG